MQNLVLISTELKAHMKKLSDSKQQASVLNGDVLISFNSQTSADKSTTSIEVDQYQAVSIIWT